MLMHIKYALTPYP